MSTWAKLKALPATVWTLGFVSLLMDVSSELIHSLLPVFMVTTLGASVTAYGLLEGIAEATSSILKVFSGALSDWLNKRKALALFGYALSVATKPLFAMAATPGDVFAARFADRLGKGIRGTPRDALIADVTPKEDRGAAFGLRQSLDTLGAVFGPLLAIGLMAAYSDDIRAVFWWSLLPGLLAVLLLAFNVEETQRVAEEGIRRRFPLRMSELLQLGREYWLAVALVVMFSLARYSEGFLILKASDSGLKSSLAPLVLIVMSAVYALTSAPAGVLSDRIGRSRLMIVGVGVLVLTDLWLAVAGSLSATFIGIAGFGLHLGLTQGLFSTLVADTAPAQLRGTAFGIMNVAMALALLLANGLAGLLWQSFGPRAMFFASALFAGLAMLGYVAWLLRTRSHRHLHGGEDRSRGNE